MKKPLKKAAVGNPARGGDEKGWGFSLLDVVFPFFLPIKGVVWIGKKLKETADAEITDKSKVQDDLLDLQMRFEMGEINEEDYKTKETRLIDRLEAIRKYEEEKV